MKLYEMIEILREDVEVPEIVRQKADEALGQIRRMCEDGQEKVLTEKKNRAGSKKSRKLAACIAVAVLAVGGVCIAAAYKGIGRSTEKRMKISGEQKEQLEQGQGLMTFPEQSATDRGITISLQDCAVDNYGARLTFRFDGYKLPEAALEDGYNPYADHYITVDGVMLSHGGSFYDGYYMPNEGGPVLKDERIQNYQFADGSMEYTVNLSTLERGFLLNKPIHVEFKEIGYTVLDNPEQVIDVEGSWVMDWTLQGSDDIYEAEIEDGAIGDTGAVLTHVELSPISARILVRYPKKEHTEFFVDEDGTTRSVQVWEEPAQLLGAKMKDGTTYYYAWTGGGGSAVYRGQNEVCEIVCNGEQILDVHQIEYLLFYKDYPEDGKVTEENFYLVKVR